MPSPALSGPTLCTRIPNETRPPLATPLLSSPTIRQNTRRPCNLDLAPSPFTNPAPRRTSCDSSKASENHKRPYAPQPRIPLAIVSHHLPVPSGLISVLLHLGLEEVAALQHATQQFRLAPDFTHTPAPISLHDASAQYNIILLSGIIANHGDRTAPSTLLHVSQQSKWLPERLQCSPTKAVEPMIQLVFQSHHRSPSLDKYCRYAIPWFGAITRKNGRHPTLVSLPREEEPTADQNRGAGLFARSTSWSRRQQLGAQPFSKEHGQTWCFSDPCTLSKIRRI